MTVASILWTRLDTPGHDACRLIEKHGGWELEGTAVFAKGGTPARLDYSVACDASWRTRWGRVRGWIGPRALDLYIARTAPGAWTMNGDEVLPSMDCVDLDLGLHAGDQPDRAAPPRPAGRPAGDDVHRVARRRRRQARSAGADLPPPGRRHLRLRVAALRLRGVLDVDATGFVRRYPRLWEAVTEE